MSETILNKGDKVRLKDGAEGEIIAVPDDRRKPYVVRRPATGDEIQARQRDMEKLGPDAPPLLPIHTGNAGDFQVTGNDVVIVASNSMELEEGQKALITSIRAKEAQQKEEIEAAQGTIDLAEKSNINCEAARKILQRAKARQLYLGKVAAALEAGYVMVPNFPGDTIAIRINRSSPHGRGDPTDRRDRANLPDEQAQRLPAGEGKYVDPVPFSKTLELAGEKPGESRFQRVATDFDEQIALPLEFLKPTVVQRLKSAMADKIFDEIVISPGRNVRRADPMVLGRIHRSRRQYRWSSTPAPHITFLIAWFQDTSVI